MHTPTPSVINSTRRCLQRECAQSTPLDALQGLCRKRWVRIPGRRNRPLAGAMTARVSSRGLLLVTAALLIVTYPAFAACPRKSNKAKCQALCDGKDLIAMYIKEADDQGCRKTCACVSLPPWTGVFCKKPNQKGGGYTKSNCQEAAACESPATIKSKCCAPKQDSDACKKVNAIPFRLCLERGLEKPRCTHVAITTTVSVTTTTVPVTNTTIALTTTVTVQESCAAYGCGTFVVDRNCQCDRLCTGASNCCSDYNKACATTTTIDPSLTTIWKGSAKCGADEVARARLASDGSVADPCTKYHWLQAPDGGYTKPPVEMSEVGPYRLLRQLFEFRPATSNTCGIRHAIRPSKKC